MDRGPCPLHSNDNAQDEIGDRRFLCVGGASYDGVHHDAIPFGTSQRDESRGYGGCAPVPGAGAVVWCRPSSRDSNDGQAAVRCECIHS